MVNLAAVLINAGYLIKPAKAQDLILPSSPIVCQIAVAHHLYGHKVVQNNKVRQECLTRNMFRQYASLADSHAIQDILLKNGNKHHSIAGNKELAL